MNKTLKAIIIDDAAQARNLLRLMLAELAANIEIVGEAENTVQAIEQINQHQPDLVFLDIEMPGKSGLQMLEELTPENSGFETIFVTAYSQYAIQAFKLSAVDYLLKPFRKTELQEAISKAKEQNRIKQSAKRFTLLLNNLKTDHNQTLCIPLNYGYEYLPLSDIEYLEAEGAYTHFHLAKGKNILVSKNLKHFENILCSLENFAKINRSYIVNLNAIKSYRKEERGILILKNETAIKISPNYAEDFLLKLKSFTL